MLTQKGVGRYAPPITLSGFVPTTRAKYYGVGANLGLGAMTPAERLRLRLVGGLGAASSESHPELVARAEQIYANSGFAASCQEVKTGWGPNGESYYNRLCALDGGPMSHAVDNIAERPGDKLDQYTIDLIKRETAAERAPGAAVITPQGVYSVNNAGQGQTTSFYEALVQSGVDPNTAVRVAQTAAPAPGPGTPAASSDPKTRVANAAKAEGDRLTFDQWNFYHKSTLGSYAPLTFEAAMPGAQRGARISIDQFWTAAYGAPSPTVNQSGLLPAGTPPTGSAGGSAGPVPVPTTAPPVTAVSPVPAVGTTSTAGGLESMLGGSIFGIPVWMLAAGGVGLFLFSGRR